MDEHFDATELYEIRLPIPDVVMREIAKRADKEGKTVIQAIVGAVCDWLEKEDG